MLVYSPESFLLMTPGCTRFLLCYPNPGRVRWQCRSVLVVAPWVPFPAHLGMPPAWQPAATQGAPLHPHVPLLGGCSLQPALPVASSCWRNWSRSVILSCDGSQSCEFTHRRVYPCAHTLQVEDTTSEPTSALAGHKEPPEP